MKLNCLQENLAQGLNKIKKAVASRSFLPVLANVMLSTDDGRLKLSATDLEIGINCWIGASIETEGATTVPARLFIDLINSLPSEVVKLNLVEKTETLKLKCGQTKANFKGIEAQEFPFLPVADSAVPLPSDLFQEMIKQVAMAAAGDESRSVLAGLLLKFEQDKLTMAAADGFRLSVRSATLKGFGEDKSIIVPSKSLIEAARLGCTGLQLNEKQVVFRGEDFNLVSQLIEGNFPDYGQIVPKEFSTEVTIDTALFLSVCKRIQIFAREGANIARLIIAPGSIEVLADSTEYGDSQEVISTATDGEPLTIGINVKYLIEALAVIPTENTILRMNSSSSPILIKPDDEDLDLTIVIMPMHVRE